MTPKFELGRDFCAMHLPQKFHHPMFTRSEVIVLTNTQTNYIACADFPSTVAQGANAIFLGSAHPGAVTPKFELGRHFCTMHLPQKFHHPMFTRSEVIVLTNTQTDAAENIQRSSLRYDVGY